MKKILLTLLALSTVMPAMAKKGLSKAESDRIAAEVVAQRLSELRKTLAPEWEAHKFTDGTYNFRFWDTIYGPKPAGGRSLIVSMHGGGGAPPAVNDQQWSNQKRLYKPAEALYFVPRAPTDSWNMWHQGYMDDFLRKTIACGVIFDGVNPDRVYITGYSAGGDGTFNMAPRMADHWAAAAMMAGHPGDAAGESLRNLPFAIFMGGADAAYNRNGLAAAWKVKLDSLQQLDPEGYIHRVDIYEGLPHWMQQRDTVGIAWMQQYTRNPYPHKVVWIQDDVQRSNFYWVGVPEATMFGVGKRIEASVSGQTVTITSAGGSPVILIGLNDTLLDLGEKVTVVLGGKTIAAKKFPRSEATLRNLDIDQSLYGIDPPYPVILKVDTKQGTVIQL